MKKPYFAIAACCALISPATGADLSSPVYKNAPAAPSVVTWTGCYAGGNIGGVVGNYNNNWTPNAAGFPISGIDLNAIGSGALNSQGITAGGQAGCNRQIGEFVVGVEGDFGYAGANATRQLTSPGLNAPPFSVTETANSSWLGTIRGRFGLATNAWLFYVTGGAALANPQFNDTACFPLGEGGCNSASGGQTKLGWTVGGGAEWSFAPHWSLKAEYLYVDLGSVSYTSSNPVAGPLATILHNHTISESIGRLGINWHF
jgi:outer membrane immunogenic protein